MLIERKLIRLIRLYPTLKLQYIPAGWIDEVRPENRYVNDNGDLVFRGVVFKPLKYREN